MPKRDRALILNEGYLPDISVAPSISIIGRLRLKKKSSVEREIGADELMHRRALSSPTASRTLFRITRSAIFDDREGRRLHCQIVRCRTLNCWPMGFIQLHIRRPIYGPVFKRTVCNAISKCQDPIPTHKSIPALFLRRIAIAPAAKRYA